MLRGMIDVGLLGFTVFKDGKVDGELDGTAIRSGMLDVSGLSQLFCMNTNLDEQFIVMKVASGQQ